MACYILLIRYGYIEPCLINYYFIFVDVLLNT